MPHPKKRLAQHFLHDPRILRRIVDALEPRPGETVLEIGPGPGGLTAHLRDRVSRLVAIEKDSDLIPGLRKRFPLLELVAGDALELDWHQIAGPGPFRVIGNIPYNITSPLLEQALRPPRPPVIVFLVQKEVAERVIADPGGAEYGALSVGVQSVARAERVFTVPAGAFTPRPKVDSAVLRLRPRPDPLIPDEQVAPFRRFVVGLFGFRRKQLVRGLRELVGVGPEQSTAWLLAAGLDPTARPQELSPEAFARLFEVVGGKS